MGIEDSSATLAGDNLYIGLQDGRLLALDPDNGEVRWEFQSSGSSMSTPTVHQGIVYSGSSDHTVYALDAATGREIWTFTTEGEVRAQPAIQGGVLAVADRDHNLYVLNARTGQKHLVFRTAKAASAAPVSAHDLVYYPAGGQIFTVDADAKEIPGQYPFKNVWAQLYVWQVPGVPLPAGQQGGRWRFAPDGPSSTIVASPAVAEEAFYVGDLQGNFYAQDALTASDLWRFKAQGDISTSPVILGDRVYFGTEDGYLYALDRSSGEMDWRLLVGAPVFRPIEVAPAFSNGRLYVRTSDGQVHAIE